MKNRRKYRHISRIGDGGGSGCDNSTGGINNGVMAVGFSAVEVAVAVAVAAAAVASASLWAFM